MPPSGCEAGRLSWSAKLEDNSDEIEVYYAWLIEDLSGGVVRVITQQTQIGILATKWKNMQPNKLLLGHQDWLDGLVTAARAGKSGSTNFGSV